MTDDPQSLLRSLQWKENTKIVNDFGEHVWLKPLFQHGKRIGITDCCFVDDPCTTHKQIEVQEKEARDN